MVKRDMFYFADIDEKFIDSTKDNEGLEDGVFVHCQQCIEKNLKAIIQKKYGLKHTTVHDLRHSHAAMLSRLDVKIIDVSKRLGHTNTRITQEVYEYLFKDIDSSVSEKLDDYYKNVLS